MSDFDDLIRAAKNHFGDDVVDDALKKVQQAGQGDGTYGFLDVKNVHFKNKTKRTKAAKASSKCGASTPSSKTAASGSPVKSSSQAVAVEALNADPPLDDPSPSDVEQNLEDSTRDDDSNDTESHSARIIHTAVKGEYLYAMLGLVLGLAAIIGGVVLCLNGVAGSSSWTAKLLALSSEVNDAAPGVILFIVGLFMIFGTRPRVKLKDLNG